MEQARHHILGQMQAQPTKPVAANARRLYPSYQIPLAHAHRAWKGHRTARKLSAALRVLKAAERQFTHAVPLQQEYVLLLAESGRYREALRLLAPLEDICRVYRDEETLCRVGRMCKDLGDRALTSSPVAARALASHPAQQWYMASLTRYRDAYALQGAYYPGINAATLARLVGFQAESQRLASAVIETCKKLDLSAMHVEDCFWVLASRAEASILLGQRDVAAETYREALGLLDPSHVGMAQSAFNQVCRLRWALGDAADAAIAVFQRGDFRLRPGPFCMMAHQESGCAGICRGQRRRTARKAG
jgi:tetratricopeptide (TPR) repeat protein